MPEREIILTLDGLKKLEKELEILKTIKRKEVAERIKEAIEFGDLSENSEYEDAKNEQAFIEGRIIALEKKLRQARIIDETDVTTDAVTIGCRVRLKDLDSGDELEYSIVGSVEADPAENKISNESPVGKALMGQRVGSVVEVSAPIGLLRFQIMDIQK
ncbi:transcription elongation factor GreA [Calderihabitans maritimus]|uniref:Transcription elongation factor GreA n=1 Tax=Calderihabitans maritimus TaxID=1246530 RepID=A0A1Z5HTY4_9FIRM|nr:transcription elongation factor GreA [Calderihabitans maritimus]GAW92878.1 GreA/GreB family elongation factor [Calderihabitans maritimus]